MGEESTEVIIAAKDEDKKETVYEIADLAYHVMVLMVEAGISMDEVKSVGMGSPGSIDDKNGVVLYANNLNLLDAPLCAEVGKHIDKPIYMGNDANCAALGEFFALED